MKLILCTNRWGFLLRFLMWSRWSHSAILDIGTGMVYDSTLMQGGVCVGPLGEFLQRYRKHEMREVEVPPHRIDAARAWLRAQVGKPYDWTALLSWVVRRDWQEPDSWFCSELTEAFITQFSLPRFREQASRITPYHQDMIV